MVTALSVADALARELEELGPFTATRLDRSALDDPGVVRSRDLLDPERLLACAIAAGDLRPEGIRTPDVVDLRAALSRFLRHYGFSFLGLVLGSLGAGVALDLSIDRCAVRLEGIPKRVAVDLSGSLALCRERPTVWQVTGTWVDSVDELRARALGTALANHLALLYAVACRIVKISDRLLWSGAGEMVYGVAESASERLDPARAAPYLADRALLFNAETVPGIRGPNPLRDLNWDEEFPEIGEGRTVGIRRVCCLSVYLPDRPGRYCGNCPLPTHAERVALHAQRTSA